MNVTILLVVTLISVSATKLIGWAAFLVFLLFVFAINLARQGTQNDKKLDEEKIQTAVENRVAIALDDINLQIQQLLLRIKQPVDFAELTEIKDIAENLGKRLTRLTDPSHCTLTKEQTEEHQRLDSALGTVNRFIFSEEKRIEGYEGSRVDVNEVVAQVPPLSFWVRHFPRLFAKKYVLEN